MTQAVDPQTQPTGAGPMLSPDDYHWAEKRGDTTGRSLPYAASLTLLILSASFNLSGPGHHWTTFTFVAAFIVLIALGFTSKRRKARTHLPLTYHLVTTVFFMGCIFFLIYYGHANLDSLYWRLPLAAVIGFTYARFFAPGAVKVPGQPGRPATTADFTAEPYLSSKLPKGRP